MSALGEWFWLNLAVPVLAVLVALSVDVPRENSSIGSRFLGSVSGNSCLQNVTVGG